jgi:hypothetical protein
MDKLVKSEIKPYILGTFTCPECGFSFSRKLILGSDELKDHIFVKDFGFIWHQIVSRMLTEGKSMLVSGLSVISDGFSIIPSQYNKKSECILCYV